jgi:hypothetical protein
MPGGTTMHRMWCGDTLVKILQHAKPPRAEAPPGGINGATGYRYFTISVNNLDEITSACETAGYKVLDEASQTRNRSPPAGLFPHSNQLF